MLSISHLCQAVLLSLLLLVAQHGALRHAMTHHGHHGHHGHLGLAASRQTDDGPRSATAERCDLCMAFAPVACGLGAKVFALKLLAGIAFARAAAETVEAATADAPASRSRGPPHAA